MAKKIAVLCGGLSKEREVSLRSGAAVYQALLQKGYEAIKLDVDRNIAARLIDIKPDVAFLALHGRYGEDGTIQGLLEILGIPYTGCGVMASAIAINKVMTKRLLVHEGISTAPFMELDAAQTGTANLAPQIAQIKKSLKLPLVVKPATEGSTIGIEFVHEASRLEEAIQRAFQFDRLLLVEEFVSGIEVTAGVLGNFTPIALPLIEIVSATGVYDYEAKYTPGMSHHIIPARIPEDLAKTIQDIAIRVYRLIGGRGLARVDFIVDQQHNPFVLEINTLPGMTGTSLFPDAARAAGMDFPELADRLVKLAVE